MAAGYAGRLLIEPGQSTHTFDASSERYTFDSETIRRQTSMLELLGLRGERDKYYGRVTNGRYSVSGGLTMRPGEAGLAQWLPRAFYGASEYDLDNSIPASAYFGVLIDKVADIHQFNDCVVSRCVFRGSAGQALTMQLDIVGMTETLPAWPGGEPDEFTYATDELPILFNTGTLTLDDTEHYFEDFELTIDNAVVPRFGYEETAQTLTPADRVVTLRVNMDYESNFYGAETAITGSLEFVPQTTNEFGFHFPKLIAGKSTPVVTTKGPVMNNVTFTAYADTYTHYTDYELYVTGAGGDEIILPLLLQATL